MSDDTTTFLQELVSILDECIERPETTNKPSYDAGRVAGLAWARDVARRLRDKELS